MSSLNKKFPRLLPEPIRKGMKVSDLIDTTFKAYNGGRLAEACRLFTDKLLDSGTPGKTSHPTSAATRAATSFNRSA